MKTTPERITPEAKKVILGAENLAKDHAHLVIEPLHLLRELLERADDLWEKLRVDRDDLTSFVDVRLARLPRHRFGPSPTPSATFNSVIERALRSAEVVDVGTLLLALSELSTSDDAGELLREFEVTPRQVRRALETMPKRSATQGTESSHADGGESSRSGAASDHRREDAISPGSTPPPKERSASGQTSDDPLLHFGRDLTELARQGKFDPIVGRSAELRRLIQILARRTKNNPVLIGEPGVGKKTIVRALARRIAVGDVPTSLRDRRIVSVEPGALLAGARMRGELEARIKSIVDALRESGGQTILFAEELAALLGAGATGGGTSGAGELLKPALARGEVRIIGCTTPQHYRAHIEKDLALARSFQSILVEEPSEKDAIAILRGVVERYEIHHGVRISDPACIAAVRHAKRYLADQSLPDSAIDLIDEAAARLRMQIDSVPAELDEIERQLEALQIEYESLHDDHDAGSQASRKEIEEKIARLVPKAKELRNQWRVEKEMLESLRQTKRRLDDARREEQTARAEGDVSKAAQLRHHLIPELREKIAAMEKEIASSVPLVREAVTEEDIAQTISDRTGIPVSKMLQDEAQRLLTMEDHLRRRVVGQDEALVAISKAVRRARVGLRDPGRPIGSFLFLGPTGVGKTELAKALAEFLFDDEAAIARIDMSEFMERHMVARLVGAPPGYVDSEQGGYLTEAVRRRPYSVVLLDEIEKAHHDVFDLLLQVLDDGRLTDGRGRLVNFSNTVIIMTSNIGGPKILEHDGDRESLRELIEQEVLHYLRPEFLNRIDDLVIFDRLSREALAGIVRIQMARLEVLLADRGISLEITDRAVDLLVELGYDPAFGARPVKRVILREIQDPMAETLLRSGYGPGDKVIVDADNGRFLFSKATSG